DAKRAAGAPATTTAGPGAATGATTTGTIAAARGVEPATPTAAAATAAVLAQHSSRAIRPDVDAEAREASKGVTARSRGSSHPVGAVPRTDRVAAPDAEAVDGHSRHVVALHGNGRSGWSGSNRRDERRRCARPGSGLVAAVQTDPCAQLHILWIGALRDIYSVLTRCAGQRERRTYGLERRG